LNYSSNAASVVGPNGLPLPYGSDQTPMAAIREVNDEASNSLKVKNIYMSVATNSAAKPQKSLF
jgi:hypothetical protein